MNTREWPREAVVAVTYRCNARCKMCDIWKVKQHNDLPPEIYAELPDSLEQINITGGEPFVRSDLVKIVHAILDRPRKPQLIISTNGFMTSRILQAVKQLRHSQRDIGIGVSLDGLQKDHDTVRGVKGAFYKATATIAALKEEGVNNIRVSYTATKDTVQGLSEVYDLSRRMGVEFSANVAQDSELYYHKMDNETVNAAALRRAFGYVNRRELRSLSPKRWFRAYFNQGVVKFVSEGKRLAPCTAGSEFFFLAPDGTVYPCLVLPVPLGNIRENSFDEIWIGKHAETMRAKARVCERCWMMCSARSSLKSRFPEALRWVIGQKLKVHMFDSEMH